MSENKPPGGNGRNGDILVYPHRTSVGFLVSWLGNTTRDLSYLDLFGSAG